MTSTAAVDLASSSSRSTVPTELVNVPYQLDAGAALYKIGLIELATGETAERDFHRVLPPEVMFYTSRVINTNPVTIENLLTLAPQLATAAASLLPGSRLDVIAYDCTSGTVALGYDEVAGQIAKGRPSVPVVTPITAAIAAIGKFGAKRVSMLTPYTDTVNQAMRGFLERHGIEVVNIASFCMESDLEMARLPPAAIRDAAVEAYKPKADALFISCTAIRAAEIVDAAERALSRPVVSSVQALIWESLRTAGYDRPITGYGRLLTI